MDKVLGAGLASLFFLPCFSLNLFVPMFLFSLSPPLPFLGLSLLHKPLCLAPSFQQTLVSFPSAPPLLTPAFCPGEADCPNPTCFLYLLCFFLNSCSLSEAPWAAHFPPTPFLPALNDFKLSHYPVNCKSCAFAILLCLCLP